MVTLQPVLSWIEIVERWTKQSTEFVGPCPFVDPRNRVVHVTTRYFALDPYCKALADPSSVATLSPNFASQPKAALAVQQIAVTRFMSTNAAYIAVLNRYHFVLWPQQDSSNPTNHWRLLRLTPFTYSFIHALLQRCTTSQLEEHEGSLSNSRATRSLCHDSGIDTNIDDSIYACFYF